MPSFFTSLSLCHAAIKSAKCLSIIIKSYWVKTTRSFTHFKLNTSMAQPRQEKQPVLVWDGSLLDWHPSALLLRVLMHFLHQGGSIDFPCLKTQLLLQYHTIYVAWIHFRLTIMPAPLCWGEWQLTRTGRCRKRESLTLLRWEEKQTGENRGRNTCILRTCAPS